MGRRQSVVFFPYLHCSILIAKVSLLNPEWRGEKDFSSLFSSSFLNSFFLLFHCQSSSSCFFFFSVEFRFAITALFFLSKRDDLGKGEGM